MNALQRAITARMDPDKVDPAELIRRLVETERERDQARRVAAERLLVNEELRAQIEQLRRGEGR